MIIREEEWLLSEINESQRIRGYSEINEIPSNWKIFYEEENNSITGFVILYIYNRLICEPDYNTGTIAEIEMFTFPGYRRKGIATRCIKRAIEYANKNGIDIVADCRPAGYSILKKLGAIDSNDKRVWIHLS